MVLKEETRDGKGTDGWRQLFLSWCPSKADNLNNKLGSDGFANAGKLV